MASNKLKLKGTNGEEYHLWEDYGDVVIRELAGVSGYGTQLYATGEVRVNIEDLRDALDNL